MTKEDVSEAVEGAVVLGCHIRLSSHQRPVIHQVASAPMPSDCGEQPHSLRTYGGNVGYYRHTHDQRNSHKSDAFY